MKLIHCKQTTFCAHCFFVNQNVEIYVILMAHLYHFQG